LLDDIDRRLLDILSTNARISLKDLAQEAGLSSPSTADRLRRLEDRGVITGFTVGVNPAALGYALQAVVRVRPMPGMLHIVEKLIQDTPEFVECDKVTGDDTLSPSCWCGTWNNSTPSSTKSPNAPKPIPRSSSQHR
jgi:Lrp/AsnC family leucine-responsive transcriptional regulator